MDILLQDAFCDYAVEIMESCTSQRLFTKCVRFGKYTHTHIHTQWATHLHQKAIEWNILRLTARWLAIKQQKFYQPWMLLIFSLKTFFFRLPLPCPHIHSENRFRLLTTRRCPQKIYYKMDKFPLVKRLIKIKSTFLPKSHIKTQEHRTSYHKRFFLAQLQLFYVFLLFDQY